MQWRRVVAAHALAAVLVFEGLLTPLALGLALLLGLEPWADLRPSARVLPAALAATLPLVAGLAVLGAARPGWFREIEALVRPLLDELFRGRGPGTTAIAVIAVSALAGLGEELLFRGVVQAGLATITGPWAAVVLGAFVFGLAHWLSRAYFVLATCMGLYLGALYQLGGDLLLPVLAHGLYDALAIVYLLQRDHGGPQQGPGAAP